MLYANYYHNKPCIQNKVYLDFGNIVYFGKLHVALPGFKYYFDAPSKAVCFENEVIISILLIDGCNKNRPGK